MLALTSSVYAKDNPNAWHPWRLREWPGRQPIGNGGPCHTHERAGYPTEISCLAHPDEPRNRTGYYVGGGCPCKGTGPTTNEGTWGWDYVGNCAFHPKVVLNWCRCRHQGGVGAYKTDGPRVPDVVPILKEAAKGPQCHKKSGEHE